MTMPNWKRVSTISMAAAALVAVSADAQAQTSATGTFTLATVNDQALPQATETNTRCREEIVSGTITLANNGDWEFAYVERETCGTDVEEDRERESGDYTLQGQSVRFSDDTDDFEADDLDVDELGVGVLSAAGLTITLQDGRTVLFFRR